PVLTPARECPDLIVGHDARSAGPNDSSPRRLQIRTIPPAPSSRRGRIIRRFSENSRDWICRTTFRKTKKCAIVFPSPRGRLEPIGNRRKEFGEAEGPQGRASGRERVNVRLRAGKHHFNFYFPVKVLENPPLPLK